MPISALSMNPTAISAAVKRMNSFVPADPSRPLGPDALTYLCSTIISENPNISTDTIVAKFRENFGLTVDAYEIRQSLRTLADAEKIVEDHGIWISDPRVATEAAKRLADLDELEAAVVAEWLQEVETGEDLTLEDEEVQDLQQDLRIYVTEVFKTQAAECVYFLTKGAAEIAAFLERVNSLRSPLLPPRRKPLVELRERWLPRFFLSGTLKRREYILQLLNSTFILIALQADRTMTKIWLDNWRGTVFYCDTNILLRILNLQGGVAFDTMSHLVDLCRSFGIKTRVTSRTIAEVMAAIDLGRREIETHPEPTQQLARAMVAAGTVEESYLLAYYEFLANGGSRRDFLGSLSLPRGHLEALGFEIHDAPLGRATADMRFRDYVQRLRELGKNTERAEHDAFHRLFILNARGGKQPDALVSAGTWFLTGDRTMCKFDRERVARRDGAPTCLMAMNWWQLARPFIPRSDDYDSTFATLLTSPYFRSLQVLSAQQALVVASRLGRYANLPERLAVRILQNQYFVERLESAESTTQADELVDLALAAELERAELELSEERNRAKELGRTAEQRDEDLARERKEKDTYAAELERFKIDLLQAQSAAAMLKADLDRERDERADAVRRLAEVEKQAAAAEQQATQSARRVEQLVRGITFTGAFGVVLACTLVPWMAISSPLLKYGGGALLAGVFLLCMSVFAGLNNIQVFLKDPLLLRIGFSVAVLASLGLMLNSILPFGSNIVDLLFRGLGLVGFAISASRIGHR